MCKIPVSIHTYCIEATSPYGKWANRIYKQKKIENYHEIQIQLDSIDRIDVTNIIENRNLLEAVILIETIPIDRNRAIAVY